MARNRSYISTSQIGLENHEQATKLAFGEKVRSLMNNLSMNQSDLARHAGLNRDAISTYVRGKAWPDPQNLRKLANSLGVTPNDLIPGMSEIEDASALLIPSRVGAAPRAAAPQTQTAQMDQVKPGVWRLRFDQTMPLETASKILAIINELEK